MYAALTQWADKEHRDKIDNALYPVSLEELTETWGTGPEVEADQRSLMKMVTES